MIEWDATELLSWTISDVCRIVYRLSINQRNEQIISNANTLHAKEFGFQGGFASKVYGNLRHQLVAKKIAQKGH